MGWCIGRLKCPRIRGVVGGGLECSIAVVLAVVFCVVVVVARVAITGGLEVVGADTVEFGESG